MLLPFDRAVGTALVYAFLDMKNIVGHAEVRPARCSPTSSTPTLYSF